MLPCNRTEAKQGKPRHSIGPFRAIPLHQVIGSVDLIGLFATCTPSSAFYPSGTVLPAAPCRAAAHFQARAEASWRPKSNDIGWQMKNRCQKATIFKKI